jgi:HEAT repeat protein
VHSEDPEIRRQAIDLVSRIGAREALPVLMDVFHDVKVRYRAAVALARVGARAHDPNVRPFLEAALANETYDDTRGYIIQALGRLGDAEAARGAAERTFASHLEEIAKPAQFHAQMHTASALVCHKYCSGGMDICEPSCNSRPG